MNRIMKPVCIMAMVFMSACTTMTSYAVQTDESADNWVELTEVKQESLVEVPSITLFETASQDNTLLPDSTNAIEKNTALEMLDASDMISQKSTNLLPDNPLFILADGLTVNDSTGIHIFSVTSDKFLVAKLNTENPNCTVRIYFADLATGTLTPSNIASTTGNLMALNNLPTGDYAFVVTCADSPAEVSYTLAINATNPAGILKKACWLTSDLQKFGILYTSRLLYSNGTLMLNCNNPSNSNLDWIREDDVNWGSGYTHRTQKLYNVMLNSEQPYIENVYSYNSSYKDSPYVTVMKLGVGTGYEHMYSTYQSGSSHTMTFYDIFGKRTPRNLDQSDFNTGYGDLLIIFDLQSGRVIDFYAPLNYYYGIGSESATLTQIS